jgi:hypothetical protein
VGVNPDGKREILGVSVSLSEHEVHWRAFLEGLKARGLGGCNSLPVMIMLVSSSSAGCFRWHSLAALSILLATECPSVCATQGDASPGRRRYPHHLQRPGSHHRRVFSGKGSCEVPEDRLTPDRVAGSQHPGSIDGLLLSSYSPAIDSHYQLCRTTVS